MIEQNPALRQIVGNANPRDVFFRLCEQKGVDPDLILSQFR